MKIYEQLQQELDAVRQKIETTFKTLVEQVKNAYINANSDVESVDDTSSIDLPASVVFIDMEDGNLIEAIETVSTSGNTVETFLNGDGTVRELDALTESQLILVIHQLEGLLSMPDKIEIN